MNWDAIGALAELAGAFGIVVTLVYLSTQLRQNSALLKASVASSSREAANELTSLLASDREAVRVFWAGLDDRDSLDTLDRQQFDAMLTLWFSTVLQGYQGGDSEVIERFDWGLHRKGVHQWWSLYASTLPTEFQAFMTTRMESIAPAA